MIVRVHRNAGEPVYLQIARQVRSRIASGEIAAGALLPSVRVLASDLGVNLNTVARAYRQLEEEGFLRIRNRAGALVLAPADGVPPAGLETLREELAQVLARMRQAGLSPADLRAVVERSLESLADRER